MSITISAYIGLTSCVVCVYSAYIGNHLGSYKKAVGQKIQKRRLELGFNTQEEFANAMDLDQSRISRWERGESLPQIRYRPQLYKVLKTDESLFEIDNNKEQKETDAKKRIDLFGSVVAKLGRLNEEQLSFMVFTADIVSDLTLADLALLREVFLSTVDSHEQ